MATHLHILWINFFVLPKINETIGLKYDECVRVCVCDSGWRIESSCVCVSVCHIGNHIQNFLVFDTVTNRESIYLTPIYIRFAKRCPMNATFWMMRFRLIFYSIICRIGHDCYRLCVEISVRPRTWKFDLRQCDARKQIWYWNELLCVDLVQRRWYNCRIIIIRCLQCSTKSLSTSSSSPPPRG